MAIKTITLLDGTTAYAHDVEDLVNPLYTDIDDSNIKLGANIQVKKLEPSTNAGDILIGNASKVPTWTKLSGNASIGGDGTLTITSGNSTSFTITDDPAINNASYYPVFVKGSSGEQTPYICSSKLVFNEKNGAYSDASTLAVDRFIGNLTGNVTGNLTGNADTATRASNLADGTYSYGSGSIIVDARNCSGNAATVTNGVYTSGSYANPTWITSLAGSKISGAVTDATNATYASFADDLSDPPTADNQLNKQALVKGWINLFISAAGAVTIRDSYNVSTATRVGSTDEFEVVWDRRFASANYVTVGSVATGVTGKSDDEYVVFSYKSATTIRYHINDSDGDTSHWNNRYVNIIAVGTLS